MLWKDLTEREGCILEHAFNINTDRPQKLTVEAGKAPTIQREDSGISRFTPSKLDIVPTDQEVSRMLAFCRTNAADFDIFEQFATGFTIRPGKTL